jgi:hypothetical protein
MRPELLQEEAEAAEETRDDWNSLLPLLSPVNWIRIA